MIIFLLIFEIELIWFSCDYLVREKVVPAEAQTRTNQPAITVLLQTCVIVRL